MTLFQYQGLSEPLPSPPTPDLSWQPRYPVTVPGRAPLATAILSACFFAPIEPPSAPQFDPAKMPFVQASEPIRIAARAQPLDVAYAPAVTRWGIDRGELPWRPAYPDFPARDAPQGSVASRTHVSYTPATSRWGLDGGQISWTPVVADFPGRGSPQGCVAARTHSVVPPFQRWGIDTGQVPWVPVVADFPGRLPPQGCVASRTQSVEPVRLSWGIETGQIPWASQGPSRVDAKVDTLSRGATVAPLLPPGAPPPSVPDLSWSPVLPSVPPPVARIELGGEVGPVLVTAPAVPALSWSPTFPAPVPAPPSVDRGALVAPVLVVAVPMSWSPVYPVLLARLGTPATGAVTEPVGQPPGLDQSWRHTQPEPVRPPAPSLCGGGVVEPVAPPPVPLLAWAPSFPAQHLVASVALSLRGVLVQPVEPIPNVIPALQGALTEVSVLGALAEATHAAALAEPLHGAGLTEAAWSASLVSDKRGGDLA